MLRRNHLYQLQEPTDNLVKLTIISSAPIIYSVVLPQLISQSASDGQKSRASLSRAAAVLLLLLYFAWVFFKTVTHRDIFHMLDYHDESWDADIDGLVVTQYVSKTRQILYAFFATTGFIAAIFCCRYLTRSLDGLVLTSSDMKTNFIGMVLLPVVVNLSNYLKSIAISHRTQQFRQTIDMTFGAGVNNVLLTMPLLVLIGWASGHEFLLSLNNFEITVFVTGVLVSSIIFMNSVKLSYLTGLIFVMLYEPLYSPLLTGLQMISALEMLFALKIFLDT